MQDADFVSGPPAVLVSAGQKLVLYGGSSSQNGVHLARLGQGVRHAFDEVAVSVGAEGGTVRDGPGPEDVEAGAKLEKSIRPRVERDGGGGERV